MKTRSCLVVLTLSLILISSLGLGSTPKAEAAVVGHFTDVEGRVDLMKGGHFPANQVKVQDPVEVGDVIRTKSLSRAQVKFVDDTVLTISPESRVGVEEYMYDGSKGQRQASLEVFRGLVHTLVTKIIKVEQPDFLIKTHTGILGIRGSDVYTQPQPTSTHFYMNSGESTVKNRWSEIKGEVHLGPRTFTVVGQGLTPTTPMHFDVEDIAHLKGRLAPQSGKGGAGGTSSGSGGGEGGKGSGQQSSQGGQAASGFTGTGEGSQPTSGSTTLGTGAPNPGFGSITGDPVTGGSVGGRVGGVYVPPNTYTQNTQSLVNTTTVSQVTQPLASTTTDLTYNIPTRTLAGTYTLFAAPNGQTADFTGSLSLTKSVVNYTVQATDPITPGGFNYNNDKTGYSGTVTWTISAGTLTGTSATGQVTGTLTATGTTSGGTTLLLNVPLTATVLPTNKLTNVTMGSISGTVAVITPTVPGNDYNSPGKSQKATDGTATATVTKTPNPK